MPSSLHFSVRLASNDDMTAISTLMKESSEKFIVPSLTKAAADHLMMSLDEGTLGRSSADVVYWVAHSGGLLLGVLGVRGGAHVLHCFVAEHCHRCGVGAAMWRFVSQQLLSRGHSARFTVNSSLFAVSFYKTLGFVAVSGIVEREGVKFVPMRLSTSD